MFLRHGCLKNALYNLQIAMEENSRQMNAAFKDYSRQLTASFNRVEETLRQVEMLELESKEYDEVLEASNTIIVLGSQADEFLSLAH
ncbi:hypothetical protein SLA2020_405070 [Shorea laevis]